MDLKLAVISHQSFSTLGGISVHIRQLAEAMVKLGVDVEVIAPAYSKVADCSSYPFKLTPILVGSRLQTMRTLEYSYKVYKYLLENRRTFDAVHGSQWSNLFIAIHKQEHKLPIITKMHGTTFYLLRSALRYRPPRIFDDIGWLAISPAYFHFEYIILKKSHGTICISRAVKNEATSLVGKSEQNRFAVIYNGVNHKAFRPLRKITEIGQHMKLGEGNKCVLYVGRIEPMKGLHYLVISMRKLLKAFPKLKLVIVGDVDEYPRYTHYLHKLIGSMKNIIFLGKVPHRYLPVIYNIGDVCVIPSFYEALGNVALEAMACGKPVIASAVGGLKELIRHCETGFLINPSYMREELIKYLSILLSNDKLARSMGRKAREFVIKNFDWMKTAMQTVNFISKLISQ
ncbi:MAG TPA: glycosyltransferase family 1 protein [Thermoprotei archaeon]|nr:glycosyltransferase family 1 protein [Thermoprotei archaeon]